MGLCCEMLRNTVYRAAIGTRECLPQRYVVSVFLFLALTVAYMMRFCLGLAIVQMNKQPATNASESCSSLAPNTNSTVEKDFEFYWSPQLQGWILSSFFYGYIITQIPGGLLSTKDRGHMVLVVGISMSTVGTALLPYAARTSGAAGIITMRILIGFGQGVVYPSVHAIASQWVPTHERSRLGCFILSGAHFGNAISMGVTGFILGAYSWPMVFYTYACSGILWIILFACFVYPNPTVHPYLGKKERALLEEYAKAVDMKKTLAPTPWYSILSSVPFWALVVGQIGHDWGLLTVIVDLPKYMETVLRYSIVENGVLLSLPYLLIVIIAFGSGLAADYIMALNLTSLTNLRKIYTAFGLALGLLLAVFSGCDRYLAVSSFIAGMGMTGFFYPGLRLNALDLSPNYAGPVSSVVLAAGSASGIAVPSIVGNLTPTSTIDEWHSVFWLSIIVLSLTCVFYISFGSAQIEPWNFIPLPEEPSHEQSEEKLTGPLQIIIPLKSSPTGSRGSASSMGILSKLSRASSKVSSTFNMN